jgi:hypothetical protein
MGYHFTLALYVKTYSKPGVILVTEEKISREVLESYDYYLPSWVLSLKDDAIELFKDVKKL